MSKLLHEKDFDVENYDEFYSHHFFAPVSDEDSVNAHRIFPRVGWALDIAEEIKPKTVLDLGCLEGYAVLTLAEHVDSIEKGFGVDLSQEGIELANKRVAQYELPCTFTQGSIEHYLAEAIKHGQKFDLIMLFEVIEHVKHPKSMLQMIDQVLAKDGTILISTPAFESPTYGKDDEQNKCHIRLYTLKDEDYEETNKYGTLRKATSMYKEIGYGNAKRGHERTVSADIYSELIHIRLHA